MLESSVTTARYLRLHSQIPIPNIHFFDSSRQNPIGAAFIVMDFIDGIPIPYSEVDPENSQQLDKIYDQACHIAYELSTHCFDRVGALYELDASLATIIGPTWDSRQNPCGPFTNAKDYYMTLSNGYWDEAQSSPHLSRLPLSENWNWNEANKSDRDLLTAFLHLKTFSLIQWRISLTTTVSSIEISNCATFWLTRSTKLLVLLTGMVFRLSHHWDIIPFLSALR